LCFACLGGSSQDRKPQRRKLWTTTAVEQGTHGHHARVETRSTPARLSWWRIALCLLAVRVLGLVVQLRSTLTATASSTLKNDMIMDANQPAAHRDEGR
jgi:hypothetical protein